MSNPLLITGFLSLCQLTFLPGWLLLKASRWHSRSFLQTCIYSFALTILTNYLIVMVLCATRLYSLPAVASLVALEWILWLYILARRCPGFDIAVPSREDIKLWLHSSSPGSLNPVLLVLALAALFAMVQMATANFGTAFHLGDDLANWDRWAVAWVKKQSVGDSSYYPQLIPSNWSLTYVLMQSTDIKLVAKAIMPLFPLATLLLFLDVYLATARREWLLGLVWFSFLLHYLFDPDFLTSGYVDLAVSFFGALTIYSILDHARASKSNGTAALLYPAVFAGTAALCKQAGLYTAVVVVVWLISRAVGGRHSKTWGRVAIALGVILVLDSWYVIVHWNVVHGTAVSNIGYLTNDIYGGRSYSQRWIAAFREISSARGSSFAPFVWAAITSLLLSIFHQRGRWALVGLFVPYYCCWAFLFSYDIRNIALGLPIGAYCCGCGCLILAGFLKGRNTWSVNPPRLVRNLHGTSLLAAGAALTAVAVVVAPGLQRWVTWVTRSDWVRESVDLFTWPLLIAGCLVALMLLALRQGPIKIRVSLPAILICIGSMSIAAEKSGLIDRGLLTIQQREQLKLIGIPSLNRHIYEYAERRGISGPIATDYRMLTVLPGLKEHNLTISFPPTITDSFLEELFRRTNPCCLLTSASRFPRDVTHWLATNGYETVFEEDGWRFVAHGQSTGPSIAPEDLTERADELFNSGKYKEALGPYELLVAINPRDATYQYRFAFCSQLSGKPDDALSAYALALDESPELEQWVRYNRGGLLLALGRLHEAESDLRRVLELAPDNMGARQYLLEVQRRRSGAK